MRRYVKKKPPLTVFNRLIDGRTTSQFEQNSFDIASIKAYLMRTDVDNHFHETGALASYFNMELISPFVDQSVLQYASKLDDKSYYGDQYLKPILREIGAKYYTPSLMYIAKLGFPAPYQSWIEGPLQALWKTSQEQLNLPTNSLPDHEYQWSFMCLQQFMVNFNINMNEIKFS